jgi:hypothetical protein
MSHLFCRSDIYGVNIDAVDDTTVPAPALLWRLVQSFVVV